MEDLAAIHAFVEAASLRSFTRAARVLGLTPSGVGKSVARLEASLGVRLLHRTTRRVELTDEGAVFFEQCRRILDELETARDLMAARTTGPRGRLRVSLPATLGRRVVLPALSGFLAAHPHVELDLSLSDRHVDLVQEGVDVAVRIGSLGDSSLVARTIGQQQIVTIAPRALAEAEPIASLGDLALHRCLSYRMPGTGSERVWTFRSRGRAIEWRPRAFLTLDDGEALVGAVRAGIGITQVPSYMADEALAGGEVVEVLAGLRSDPVPIHAVFASSRNLPARTRAFIDFMVSLHPIAPASSPAPRAAGRRPKRG